MSESKKEELKQEQQFEHTKLTAWESLRSFFVELFSIHLDSDRESTIAAVKQDIPFKGHNAWILIFSIFVASIGLNVSSTAVVIGAMLISPLMGPIVGIGLSVAINDLDTMRRSFINLGVMIVLSVTTATFYFWVSPLTEETPELVARTYPTILDVLIAIFGGLALIVAKTKKGTIASVIFGVAIATALMPPLCTVGYGLAVGNFPYAWGALYLFSINAVFIALSAFLVAKLLRFPMVRYADSKRRRIIAQLASLLAIIIVVPSVILFLNLLKVQVFENRAKEFVKEVVQYEGAEIVKYVNNYETKKLELYLIGRPVPQTKIDEWITTLKTSEKLENCELIIYQGTDRSNEIEEKISGNLKSEILEDLYVNNEQRLHDKNDRIIFLEEEIAKLKVKDVAFSELSEEVKLVYTDLDKFSYSKRITTNFQNIDTLAVFNVSWNEQLNNAQRQENNTRLKDWLQFKLKLDTLKIEE